MFDVAASLQGGFTEADRRLRAAQEAVAQSQTGGSARAADAAMAKAANGVIFSEALLAATRARFQEIERAARS